MKLLSFPRNRIRCTVRGRRHGFTLVETVMATAIGVLALSATSMMVLLVGAELKGSVTNASVEQEGGLLEDQVVNLLRSMSATEGVVFLDPVPNKPALYQRIVLAKGPAPANPREQLYYNSTNFTLYYDPNRAVTGNETSMYAGSRIVTLRNLYFFPSLKPGGVPDDATINVVMQLDDAKAAPPKNASATAYRTNSVLMSFSVRVRSG